MCEICGDPSCQATPEEMAERLEAMRERMKKAIVENGCFIIHIEGPNDPSFSYTIGMAHKGLPDLIIHAQRYPEDGQLLDDLTKSLGEYWQHRSEMQSARGYMIKPEAVIDPYRLCLVELEMAPSLENHLIQAARYYEREGIEPVGVVQVFWPDKENCNIYDGMMDPEVWACQAKDPPINREVLGPLARVPSINALAKTVN